MIGGATLYEQTLDVANRLYITHIEESFDGDTHFPAIDLSEWKVISKQQGIKDEKIPTRIILPYTSEADFPY